MGTKGRHRIYYSSIFGCEQPPLLGIDISKLGGKGGEPPLRGRSLIATWDLYLAPQCRGRPTATVKATEAT